MPGNRAVRNMRGRPRPRLRRGRPALPQMRTARGPMALPRMRRRPHSRDPPRFSPHRRRNRQGLSRNGNRHVRFAGQRGHRRFGLRQAPNRRRHPRIRACGAGRVPGGSRPRFAVPQGRRAGLGNRVRPQSMPHRCARPPGARRRTRDVRRRNRPRFPQDAQYVGAARFCSRPVRAEARAPASALGLLARRDRGIPVGAHLPGRPAFVAFRGGGSGGRSCRAPRRRRLRRAGARPPAGRRDRAFGFGLRALGPGSVRQAAK